MDASAAPADDGSKLVLPEPPRGRWAAWCCSPALACANAHSRKQPVDTNIVKVHVACMSSKQYRHTNGLVWTLEEEHPESLAFRARRGRRTAYRVNVTRRGLAELLATGELTPR